MEFGRVVVSIHPRNTLFTHRRVVQQAAKEDITTHLMFLSTQSILQLMDSMMVCTLLKHNKLEILKCGLILITDGIVCSAYHPVIICSSGCASVSTSDRSFCVARGSFTACAARGVCCGELCSFYFDLPYLSL